MNVLNTSILQELSIFNQNNKTSSFKIFLDYLNLIF